MPCTIESWTQQSLLASWSVLNGYMKHARAIEANLIRRKY